MRLVFDTALAFAVAAITAVPSAAILVDRAPLFASLSIGNWAAWTKAYGVEGDPYDAAATARAVALPLGASEGLAFTAVADQGGRPLDTSCAYQVDGNTPSARLWTLTAYGVDATPLQAYGRASSLHSRGLLRRPDGSFQVVVAPAPTPGNWLPVPAGRPFVLVLRLYDTPLTSGAGTTAARMPTILPVGCP